MHTKQILCFLAKTVMVLSMILQPSYALDQRELTIKAAYLFRFSLFVEWPETSLKSVDMVFCIAGDEKITQILKDVLKGRQRNQQAITVTKVKPKDDLSICHLLYIPQTSALTEHFLNAVQNRPILTVGESDIFLHQDGMIYLFKKDNRIRFAINQDAAKSANLSFRAQLLKLAEQP